MYAMLSKLPSGGPTHATPVNTATDLSFKEKIRMQVHEPLNYVGLPGVRDGLSMCRWWASPQAAHFHLIRPIARFLLSIPAGNSALERHFGRFAELFHNPQRLQSMGNHVLLAINGPNLGMAGFPQEVVEIEEDLDELVHEIPRVAMDVHDLMFAEDPDF